MHVHVTCPIPGGKVSRERTSQRRHDQQRCKHEGKQLASLALHASKTNNNCRKFQSREENSVKTQLLQSLTANKLQSKSLYGNAYAIGEERRVLRFMVFVTEQQLQCMWTGRQLDHCLSLPCIEVQML